MKTPISEEQYGKICKLAGKYSENTYNEISGMQADYCSSVDTIMHSAGASLKNHNAQTQAQFDSAPQFGTFFGNVENDMFGNTRVYGAVYTDNSSRRAEQYIAASQNKVTVEYETKNRLAHLKEESVAKLDAVVVRVLREFKSDLYQLIVDEIYDVFEYTVFCGSDLVSRPF